MGLPFGLLVGCLSSLMARRMLPFFMRGKAVRAALLMMGRMLLHIAALTAAALISGEALLWTAAGDVAALLGFAGYEFVTGRK